MPIPFTVIVDDKEYKCSREVEKIKDELIQHITVEGFGFETDADYYWDKSNRNIVMDFRAKRIAQGIILKRLSTNIN